MTQVFIVAAYVSEQNLLPDDSGDPVEHPEVSELFGKFIKWKVYPCRPSSLGFFY